MTNEILIKQLTYTLEFVTRGNKQKDKMPTCQECWNKRWIEPASLMIPLNHCTGLAAFFQTSYYGNQMSQTKLPLSYFLSHSVPLLIFLQLMASTQLPKSESQGFFLTPFSCSPASLNTGAISCSSFYYQFLVQCLVHRRHSKHVS